MAGPLNKKSYSFALRIIKLCGFMQNEKKEFILSKQLLRSGTAIGALIREAEYAQSRADFASKMSIALKEANETDYWISLLKDSGYINEQASKSVSKDLKEIIAMLVSSVKTSKIK